MTGAIAIVMSLSIPIVAIVTSHLRSVAKMKKGMLRDELELERLKHENFLLETEKMRLELNKMQLEQPPSETMKPL